jgi:hypothetical protein|nr:MAG TPA: hypothetical protein [Caudoviricetes sp.]
MELIYAYTIGCWIIALGCIIPVLFYMRVDSIGWEDIVISIALLIFSPIIISGVILGLLGMTIYKCLKKK